MVIENSKVAVEPSKHLPAMLYLRGFALAPVPTANTFQLVPTANTFQLVPTANTFQQ